MDLGKFFMFVVSLCLIGFFVGLPYIFPSNQSQPHILISCVIGLGLWLGLLTLFFAKVGENHGWYHGLGTQNIYRLMRLWFPYLFIGSFFIPRASTLSAFQNSRILQFYTLAVIGVSWFIIQRCMIFRVQTNSRVIAWPRVLQPGQIYLVFPFTASRYNLLRSRMTLPPISVCVNCSEDRMRRHLTVAPVVEIDLERIQPVFPDDYRLKDFIGEVRSAIERALSQCPSPFLHRIELRPIRIEAGDSLIPFTWKGEGGIIYETHHCLCQSRDCQICNPGSTPSWHA